jgi:hypothetical protein
MQATKHLLFFVSICMVSFFCVKKIYTLHSSRDNLAISYLGLLPEQTAQVVSIEFQGVFSDYLMLNILTFMGERVINKETMTQAEWQKTYQALKQTINLDPMATDPFTLATTTLPWEAGMVEETNELLLKAAKAQTTNPRPYFFLWFNHFYFLKDHKLAGYYLQKAAEIPGSPKFYATLAARMKLISGELQGAILFLQEMINETTDSKRKYYLQLRLQALKIILFLENNLLRYKKKFGKMPENLEDLVNKRIIKSIPPDPYGGNFYIMENGRVYTTSKLVQSPKK